MANKSKLDKLMGTVNPHLPLTVRHTPKVLAKYESDLNHVVDGFVGGKALPTRFDLAAYFLDEYGIAVSENTLGRHIKLLKEGKRLWPAK